MVKTQKKAVRKGRFVDTAHVDTVIRNYKKERWAANSKRLGKEDSLSVWYSIEEIETFLNEAKAHGADGVKMYFGAYGHDDAPRPGYEGRQTIVMVATKEKQSESGLLNKDLYVNNDKGTNILAYNVGSLCPPLCANDDNGLGITIVDRGNELIIR